MQLDSKISLNGFSADLDRFFSLAGKKTLALDARWKHMRGAPVFTVEGQYVTRGWTDWTQGFQFGAQLLLFDVLDDGEFLRIARENIRNRMSSHVTHCGVHDHGFNNISTYGNLRRLARSGRVPNAEAELAMCEMALKASGAVQAMRWSPTHNGGGYMYSFNGPHSLFSDTIRSCRSLVLADALGQSLMGENDAQICLMTRAMQHIRTTLKHNVFYGENRDLYDKPGRVAHEGLFNTNDGRYRCPSTQQGYSPFSTWTRGLAWILLGCTEQLEFFASMPKAKQKRFDAKGEFTAELLRAARLTADFYIANSSRDGIALWDTGAPGVASMGDYTAHDAVPDNPHEPFDSSAAAIAAQGMLRLGEHLGIKLHGKRYWQAGLGIAQTLLSPSFVSKNAKHEGLVLHAIYHRPNAWDHVPKKSKVPHGEACMWGDYHALELALYLHRKINGEKTPCFFD